MGRLQEIELRLSAIKIEIDKDSADLNALETEINELKEERKTITEKIEKRKALLDDVAAMPNPVVIKDFAIDKEERKVEITIDNVLGSLEFRSGFLKNLQGKTLNEVEQRALSTASNSSQAAVPQTLVSGVIDKLVQTSVLFNRISVTHIPGNVKFAVANAKNDAAWKAENVDGTATDDTVTEVTLAGFELIKLVEISAAARAMTIDAFEQYLIDEIGRRMAIAIENAILNGTGTGQPKGILAETLIDTKYTKLGMVYKDMLKIMATLPTLYHRNACFCMPRKLFFEEVLGIVDTYGRPIVVADVQSPAKFNILGYPVEINDLMPLDTIVFGDYIYYKMNFSQDPIVEADSSVGFKSGKVTYRGMAVADGKVALAEAFVKGTRSAT